MELTFESSMEITSGLYPDVIQFYDTSAEIFSIVGGELKGNPIKKLNGVYDSPQLEDQVTLSPDSGITNFELKTINGFGAVGSYLAGDTHKMLIYEFALEMDRFLNAGSVRMQIGNPINSFALTLENPIDDESDLQTNAVMSEETSLFSPGAKVSFEAALGDSEPVEMGFFYVDRSNYSVLGESVSIDGRNLIGKALKDQTMDENNAFGYSLLDSTIKTMLENANINSDQFQIDTANVYNSFSFKPTTNYLDALNEILKAMINWKIEELTDGTIVIGAPSYGYFSQNSTYTFERGKDIFSREIIKDDMSAYRRVCVHDNDFNIEIYRNVGTFSGWNLQSSKTLFVSVPEGTREAEAIMYADELATRIENVGQIESFSGPFRPYLIPGDEAVITSESGSKIIGLITEIEHAFGKSGFFTSFVVDSGGRLGKGRISDYITKITQPKTSGSIGYEAL